MSHQYNLAFKKLSSTYCQLKYSLQNLKPFNFIEFTEHSRVLFLGEGNFSFSLSIANKLSSLPKMFIATSFNHYKKWSEDTLQNVSLLLDYNACVLHSIDATKLDQTFHGHFFDLIIFSSPILRVEHLLIEEIQTTFLLENSSKALKN